MRPQALLDSWPLARQFRLRRDRLGRAAAAQSPRSRDLRARTHDAEVTRSICPYCAVGCGQLVYVKDGEVIQIEGDPGEPDLARPPLPEGLGVEELRRTARCASTRSSTAVRTAPTGRSSRSTRRWT